MSARSGSGSRPWSRLFAHAGDGRRLLIAGFVLITVDAVMQSSTPAVFRSVLNSIETDPQAFIRSGWRAPALAAAALAIGFLVSAYLAHTATRRGAARWASNLRRSLYEHTQQLSLDFFSRSRVGDVAARINQDIERLELGVSHCMSLLWASVMLVLAVALMAWIDVSIALVALAMLAVAAVWTVVAVPKLRRTGRAVRDEIGSTAGIVSELLSANGLIKAFNGEADAADRVGTTADRVRAGTERLVRLQYRYSDVLGFHVAFVAPFVLLFVGAVQVSHGALLIGDVVALWAFWQRGSGALTAIVTTVPEVLAGLTAGERAAEILDERPTVPDVPGAPELVVTRGAIRFEDVTFAYPGRAGGLVLDGFDLAVEGGERVALVGPSGVGKSTVAQLLLRFYDPTSGRVWIDGQDIREVAQASLRARIGVVFQDNVLLGGTLARNLRLAKPTATEDEMRLALEAAHAWEFVSQWETGLETDVGERGLMLSGGQRQRLAIARVMLKDPAIIILDEATSALDATTERVVIDAFERLLDGRTSLVIAHRLATVRNADRIAVLEPGRVGDVGTHDALLETSAVYRSYCAQQSVT